MELLPLVCVSLLTWSGTTFAENVEEGSDVTLPCSLSTKENITSEKFEWKKDNRQVFLYDDGNHSNNNNTGQDQQFKDRVSHFPEKLKSGDASITIRDTKLADSGEYTCNFTNLQPRQTFYIKLVVEPKVIRVDKGIDVILPCSLNTKENITREMFEWKKDGRQVFLYDDGNHSNNNNTTQDQQFKDRVEHFPDKLKSGDASITIRNTKVADSGNYTCEFPLLQQRQIFHIELIVETTFITEGEGCDVMLPCSLSTKENITSEKFEWKKDGRQVFLYDDGGHSNINNTGQDQQFRGRVSHFPDELKSGDASITIRDTKVADSGDYTCEFTNLQPGQTSHIKLLVYVEAPKPSITILDQTKDWALLQCEVQGAFPKPELHWEDRAGNKLPAEEPQESERGGRYNIILQTTVTKTAYYRCVATQKEINHQTHYETNVPVPSAAPRPHVRILDQTKDWAQLQCEVQGAFPKPELHWEDGAGNKLPADKPQERERGGIYDIILKTTVTKTDVYRCNATQEEINHQTHYETYVYIPGKNIENIYLILAVTALAVVLALLFVCILYKKYQKGRTQEEEVVYIYAKNGEATS